MPKMPIEVRYADGTTKVFASPEAWAEYSRTHTHSVPSGRRCYVPPPKMHVSASPSPRPQKTAKKEDMEAGKALKRSYQRLKQKGKRP